MRLRGSCIISHKIKVNTLPLSETDGKMTLSHHPVDDHFQRIITKGVTF
jgi:hypothetical protein